METFFFFQGLLALLVWIIIELISFLGKRIPKFWRKHCNKRKRYFTLFAVSFFFMGWSHLESLFSTATETGILIFLSLSFWFLVFWSGYYISKDYIRIKKAIERRKK